MQKFTIITVILAVSIITVTADLAVRNYMVNKESQTNLLNITTSTTSTISPPPPSTASVQPPAAPPPPAQAFSPLPASELSHTDSFITLFISKITPSLITEAGFNVKFSKEPFSGKIFSLLDITQIPVDDVNFYQLSENDIPIVSLTEVSLRDEIRALQLYLLLQNKTKPYIDLTLNETNAYGDRSFYINHGKKPAEAFLAVKIGKTIYTFAYVKTYHAPLKKLIQLLSS